eukprot:TRINITY_DN820_c0_g1_i5.p1 TRINITY_DN820_c0_g1~~TRINITY_DN820_c0_g1_i5.p1  ORF type:complete len:529 (+),score=47.86 TRINITY_DN820_c0_g1_i5:84-1670(+)
MQVDGVVLGEEVDNKRPREDIEKDETDIKRIKEETVEDLLKEKIKKPQKKYYRARAHCNPLSDNYFPIPPKPDAVDWSELYPKIFPTDQSSSSANVVPKQVDMVDVGCGFGGFLIRLSELYPDKLVLGMEIQVTFYYKNRTGIPHLGYNCLIFVSVVKVQQEHFGLVRMGATLSSLGSNSTTFTRIRDNYRSLREIQEELISIGLESSNLIIGIDFTKSNEWTGKDSFDGRNLHSIQDNILNPYEEAMAIVANTLPKFDEDAQIPCYGFGDVTTHDKSVFCFNQHDQPCDGLEGVLTRYREIVPYVQLSGPTSYGPIIRQAMQVVKESGFQYHLLLIIADGQVTRGPDVADGKLSYQEYDTIHALVQASGYPLSIVVVGVGDGPWDHMSLIDDEIRMRKFDNLQFVNFTAIMAQRGAEGKKEADFALMALMEVPDQYRFILQNGMLSRPVEEKEPFPKALPPPKPVLEADEKRNNPQEDEMLDEQVHLQLQQLIQEKAILCQEIQNLDRKSTRLNSSHQCASRMPSSA